MSAPTKTEEERRAEALKAKPNRSLFIYYPAPKPEVEPKKSQLPVVEKNNEDSR